MIHFEVLRAVLIDVDGSSTRMDKAGAGGSIGRVAAAKKQKNGKYKFEKKRVGPSEKTRPLSVPASLLSPHPPLCRRSTWATF